MKTPYDALVRLRGRELDEHRLRLAAAEDGERAAGERLRSIEAQAINESEAANGLTAIDFTGYRQRVIARLADASADHGAAKARVDSARTLNIEAFIAKKTADLVVDRFVSQVMEDRARAEQARLDEIAARARPL